MFFRNGIDGGNKWRQLANAQDRLAFAHCEPIARDKIIASDRKIITTIRDPLYTAASWYAHNELDYDAFESSWQLWREIVVPRAIAVLSIDHNKEQRWLDARGLFGVNDEVLEGGEIAWNDIRNSSRHNSLIHHFLDTKQLVCASLLLDLEKIRKVVLMLGDALPDEYRWWL